jgi:6-pyruvoyltetrahydropterin/6-carboxytetrahydropterin synthase
MTTVVVSFGDRISLSSSLINNAMPSFLTRRVTFAAAHRYRRPDWSEERNMQVFGLCARENFHGHSYVCDVRVTGKLDPTTGMIVDLAQLDRVLAVEVRERFDHRNINLDVPEFADGKLVPTGEELSRFIFDRVQAELVTLGTNVSVIEVTLSEDATLSASYRRD